PKATKGMHGNGAARIVDAEMRFEPFHRVCDERASNRANHEGCERANERAGSTTGHQSANPAIGTDGDIGPAKTHARDQDGCENAAPPAGVRAELREPAAAPDPMREEGVCASSQERRGSTGGR